MKQEIEQRIELLEQRLFLIDMVDRWDEEDKQLYKRLSEEIKELKKQLENLPKENHE